MADPQVEAWMADPQVEAWVAQKQKGYVKFGATPEQLAQWAEYDRKRYTAFVNQKAPVPTGASLTLAELTHRMLDQGRLWASLVTRARELKNPASVVGLRFLRNTWEPVLTVYLDRTSRLDQKSTIARAGVNMVMEFVRERLYPAAQQAGFPESSFVLLV